jgi:hypothetical protein
VYTIPRLSCALMSCGLDMRRVSQLDKLTMMMMPRQVAIRSGAIQYDDDCFHLYLTQDSAIRAKPTAASPSLPLLNATATDLPATMIQIPRNDPGFRNALKTFYIHILVTTIVE